MHQEKEAFQQKVSLQFRETDSGRHKLELLFGRHRPTLWDMFDLWVLRYFLNIHIFPLLHTRHLKKLILMQFTHFGKRFCGCDRNLWLSVWNEIRKVWEWLHLFKNADSEFTNLPFKTVFLCTFSLQGGYFELTLWKPGFNHLHLHSQNRLLLLFLTQISCGGHFWWEWDLQAVEKSTIPKPTGSTSRGEWDGKTARHFIQYSFVVALWIFPLGGGGGQWEPFKRCSCVGSVCTENTGHS